MANAAKYAISPFNLSSGDIKDTPSANIMVSSYKRKDYLVEYAEGKIEQILGRIVRGSSIHNDKDLRLKKNENYWVNRDGYCHVYVDLSPDEIMNVKKIVNAMNTRRRRIDKEFRKVNYHGLKPVAS